MKKALVLLLFSLFAIACQAQSVLMGGVSLGSKPNLSFEASYGRYVSTDVALLGGMRYTTVLTQSQDGVAPVTFRPFVAVSRSTSSKWGKTPMSYGVQLSLDGRISAFVEKNMLGLSMGYNPVDGSVYLGVVTRLEW